jgi:hypothetical protein
LYLAASDILRLQGGHCELKIVTHEVKNSAEKIVSGVLLRKLTLERMDCGLRRRHRENQPLSPDINALQSEHIAEKGPICLGILAIKQKMSTRKHEAEYIPSRENRFDRFAQRSLE